MSAADDGDSAANPVDRLLEALGITRDAELVEILGSRPQTVSSWRSRARVPMDAYITVAERSGCTLDWLVTGRGAKLRSDAPAYPIPAAGPYPHVAEPRPPPIPQSADTDERLDALLDWLRVLWADATEEERAWLVVELRLLRRRLRDGGA